MHLNCGWGVCVETGAQASSQTKRAQVGKWAGRGAALSAGAIASLWVRVWVMQGQVPAFARDMNPAAFESDPVSRRLTFAYVAAYHIYLMLWPQSLSCSPFDVFEWP